MQTSEIRQKFLDYFASKNHKIIASSRLVPNNDPTLLFTNAGMVQFKDVFIGSDTRDYSRATSSQRCVRAGGKHNDLDNVGYTARHHTFFEMLGNFSFGDYFKLEAIQMAWEFLTQVLNIPEAKLWVTVHTSDDEAADIWLNKIGVDPNRFSRCGDEDNFWSMGDTGPCGPCTEIFYDHGPDVPGGPPGSSEAEEDRYVEIWNLVFMQYNRDNQGNKTPLPKPSVDTGMGLERIAAVLQGVHSNYNIDLFQHLIKAAAKAVGTDNLTAPSLNVIADHIRSACFLIVDGVSPSNDGRGYVLRRIIRRAVRHGHKLGCDDLFFASLVPDLVKTMGETYPELTQSEAHLIHVLTEEETQFARTVAQGLRLLEQDLEKLTNKLIPGSTVFKLYDTYGFPVDLTADIARERGLELDLTGFEACMAEQRAQSQAASQFGAAYQAQLNLTESSRFTGYNHTTDEGQVTLILQNNDPVSELNNQSPAILILNNTPFYAESGGQVGDIGEIVLPNGKFRVEDTQKSNQAILHIGHLMSGVVKIGDHALASVEKSTREAIALNHTATHLLHAALRKHLGEHVIQKGSLVDSEKLRFDFSHPKPVSPEELKQLELLVNQEIRHNYAGQADLMTFQAAQADGAMALFGEKYDETVRVLSLGNFSKELCGGTHAYHTGNIGLFKILTETGVAAGIRRIEAMTGEAALHWVQHQSDTVNQLADLLKTDNLLDKTKNLLQTQKQLSRALEAAKAQLATQSSGDLTALAVKIGEISVLATNLGAVDNKTLRQALDTLKEKLKPAVVVLVGVQGEKMSVVAGISKSLIGQVPSAKVYVEHLCGRGGGRDDMAQGGGSLIPDLESRLEQIPGLLETV